MDQPRKPKRSASDGSLHRSYSASSLPQPRPGPSYPFLRPPLRSVNENSLLISPGPLESMLKKTTETGDIGIFSIRPPRPAIPYHASSSHHALPRSRSAFGEANVPRPRTSGSGSGSGGDSIPRDDRRRLLPSYRDPASEIISMYGSDSQRSVSSSLSVPFDGMDRHTNSMTSCSSRPLPHQRSNGTMQSQSSGIMLQRPRSPFPYPTRLKRPGVRPSSPAITENGRVDYSRMVGIDRGPSRAIHVSYMPNHAPPRRRTGPRYGCLDAYSSGRSSSRYEGAVAPQYMRVMSSSSSRHKGRYSNVSLGATVAEKGRRTSSLASMGDMGRPPSSTQSVRSCPLLSQGSGAFYYDYSEDFEDRATSIIPTPVPSRPPLAPIPTRAPSSHRASVLNDSFDSSFQVRGENDLAIRHQRRSPNKSYRGLLDPEDQSPSPHPSMYQFAEDGYLGGYRHTSYGPAYAERSSGEGNHARSRFHHEDHGGSRKERPVPGKDSVELLEPEVYGQENQRMVNVRQEMLPATRPNEPKDGLSASRPHRLSFETRTHPNVNPGTMPVFSLEPGLEDLADLAPHIHKNAEWSDDDEANSSICQVDSVACLQQIRSSHEAFCDRDHTLDGVDPNSRPGISSTIRTKDSISRLLEALPPSPTGSKCESCIHKQSTDYGPTYLGQDEVQIYNGRDHLADSMGRVSADSACAPGSLSRPRGCKAVVETPRTTPGTRCHSARPGNGRLKLRVSRAALGKVLFSSRGGGGGRDGGPENPQSIDSDDCTPTGNEAHGGDERKGELVGNLDQTLSTADGEAPSSNGSGTVGNVRGYLSDKASGSSRPGRGLKSRVSDLCVRLAGSSIRSSKGRSTSSDADSFAGPARDNIHEKHGEDSSRPSHTFPRQLRALQGRSSRWLRVARHAVMAACAGSRKH